MSLVCGKQDRSDRRADRITAQRRFHSAPDQLDAGGLDWSRKESYHSGTRQLTAFGDYVVGKDSSPGYSCDVTGRKDFLRVLLAMGHQSVKGGIAGAKRRILAAGDCRHPGGATGPGIGAAVLAR